MAKLYFYYGAMNAGKSTHLLQSAHNYEERGMKVSLYSYDSNEGLFESEIKSRIGISKVSKNFNSEYPQFRIHLILESQNYKRPFSYINSLNVKSKCVLIDESQFLSKRQVYELMNIVDELKIPVMCYGLRTDFQGNLFEGSAALLALADEIIEIKSICHCGKKATMQARIDSEGKRVREGDQVMIGGNESYVSLCRKHFYE